MLSTDIRMISSVSLDLDSALGTLMSVSQFRIRFRMPPSLQSSVHCAHALFQRYKRAGRV
jgi:hypothetical protein